MRAKAIIINVVLFCCTHQLRAQSISPEVIPTQGSYSDTGKVGMTWTIGEPFIQSMSGGGINLTLGFEQPDVILPPVAPTAQTVCSDTAYTFTFSGVTTGNGGDEIEWATNSNFTSSTIIGSPGNISVTVNSGSADTIWIRSKIGATGEVSKAVYTTATVIPAIHINLVSNSDSFYCFQGNLGVIHASATGGVYPYNYLWSNADTSQNIFGISPGSYTVSITDLYGCADSASTEILCKSGCGIDTMSLLCSRCIDDGINIEHFWSINFNYGLSSGSLIKVSSVRGIPIQVWTRSVVHGSNQIMVTATNDIWTSYSYDTLSITVIDSASGDTCIHTLPVSLQCNYLDYFQPCDNHNVVLSAAQVYCQGTDNSTGLPMYMITLHVTNNSSENIYASVIRGLGIYEYAESGGWFIPGTTVDTIHIISDSSVQQSACIIYGTSDTNLCPVCSQQICIDLPSASTPRFIFGDLILCKGSSDCYQAIAGSQDSISYSIVSGSVTIDSLTGCVNNAQSDFIIRALSRYGCTSAWTDINVEVVPHISVSPADTIVWMGDTVLLQAIGAIEYYWNNLSQYTPQVIVSPIGDSTIYRVVGMDTLGCSDSVSATVRTIDTLIMSIINMHDTIYPHQTTSIIATSNLPGANITWYRDNLSSISGDSVGTGSILNGIFTNITPYTQTEHFHFRYSDKGVDLGDDSTGNTYIPGQPTTPEINVSVGSSDSIALTACVDTLYDTIALYNITSATSFNIYQVLPEGAVVISTNSSCSLITDTLYNNHLFPGNTDSIKWTISQDTINACLLITAIGFNCASSYPNGGSSNGLTTKTDLPLNGVDTLGFSFGLNIIDPTITVTNITPTSASDYALKGDTEIHKWSICVISGSIDNLTLTYKPEYETNSENITLRLYYDTNQLIENLTGGDALYIFNIPIDSLMGRSYLDKGQCIYLEDTAIVVECSVTPDQDTLEASMACSFGGNCSSSALATAKVIVQDDFDEADNSPIGIDSFELLQGGIDVTATGITPCDTETCTLKYVIGNPERSNDSLPPDANFKILGTFSTFVSSCWFNTDSMHVYLCDSTGSHCILLNSNQYTYVEPGNLSINFNSLGGNASSLFGIPPSIYADTAYNEMHENSKFLVSITGLVFNQNCSYLTNCNAPYNGSIIGLGSGSTIGYYTMCGDSVTQSLLKGDYVNVVGFTPVLAVSNDVEVGRTFTFDFGWNNPGTGNPWSFLADNKVTPFFNCPNPVYTVNIFVPTDFNYIIGANAFYMQTGANTNPFYLIDSSQISGPVLQTMQNDTFNVYTISDLSTPATIQTLATFEGGPKCNGQGEYDTFYAEVFAACGDSTCPDDLFCIGIEPNQIYLHCQGQCEYPIGLDSTNPVIVQRILIPAEYNNSGGPTDSSQAYPCDTVMITAKGFANHNYITGLADSIYLRVTYPLFPLLMSNTLFSVASADYSVDAVHWTSVANTSGPNLYYDSTAKALVWMVDACLPGGCDSGSVSSVFMLKDTVFYVRVKLIVNNNANLPYIGSLTGVYYIGNIRADMRVMSCTGIDYHSCDTYAGSETLIQHNYSTSATFLSPGYSDADFGSPVNICTQRLEIVTSASGGLTQNREMPNETRPLIVWPDNSKSWDTLQLLVSPSSMILDSAKFRGPLQSSSYTPLSAYNTPQNFAAASFLGVDSNGWPILTKSSGSLYWLQLLATFDKLDCANAAQTDSLRFNYWIRGGGNECLSASAFFQDSAAQDTDMLVTTYPTDNSVTLSTYEPDLDIYAIQAKINNYTNDFTFSSILQYQGSAAGANYTWIYAKIPFQVEWLKLYFPNGSYDSIISQVYDTTGPLLIPPGVDTVFFECKLADTACGFQNFTVDFYTGYSCNWEAIPTSIASIPSDTNSFDCGIVHSSVNIGPASPYFSGDDSCSTCTFTKYGDFCSNFEFTFTDKSYTFANTYNPTDTILVPAHTILKSVSITLQCDESYAMPDSLGPEVDSPNIVGDGGIFYSCTNLMQTLLTENGYILNGETYLPNTCQFNINTIFTGIDNTFSGTATATFEESGENMCGANTNSLSQSAVMTFTPLTIDSFNSNLCSGSDSLTVYITPGIANYSYYWSGLSFTASDTNTTATSQTVLVTDTGTYYLTVTDHPGCSVTDSIHITQIAPVYPTVSAGPDANICAWNDSIGIVSDTLQGSDSGATAVIWSTSGDGHFSNDTILNPIYSPGPSDTSNHSVLLMLTAYGNPGCITISDTMLLTIIPNVLPNFVIDSIPYPPLCYGDTIILIPFANYDGDAPIFNWYVNNTLATVIPDNNIGYSNSSFFYPVQNNDTSVYCIMISNAACALQDSIHSSTLLMTVYPRPAATISFTETSGITNNDGIICLGDSVTLTANPTIGMYYSWSNSIDTTNNIIVSPVSKTYYSVTVTDSIAGCSATTTDTITVNPLPVAHITETDHSGKAPDDGIICSDDTAFLSANAGTGYTYLWSGTGGTTQNVIALYSYNATVTVTNSYGCSAKASDTIISFSPPAVSITQSGSVNYYTGSGSDTLTTFGGVSYVWSDGETTSVVTNPQSGPISVTVTDANGCTNGSDALVFGPNPDGNCVGQDSTVTFFSSDGDDLPAIIASLPSGVNRIALNGGSFGLYGSTLTISDLTIYMGHGTNIALNEGDHLNLVGCALKGCVYMWEGILVSPEATISMNKDTTSGIASVVEDALIGIEVSGSSGGYLTANIANTQFYRNYIGLEFSNCSGEYNIYGNTFDFKNPHEDPTFGIKPLFDSIAPFVPRSDIGILITSSKINIGKTSFVSANSDTFQNIYCGVYSYNSQVNIYNNYFNNIRAFEGFKEPYYLNIIHGTAIYAEGGQAVNNSSLLVETHVAVPQSNSTISFNNCDYGLWAAHTSVNFLLNRMDNVGNGVYLNNCSSTVLVSSNYMTNTNAGITLNSNVTDTQDVWNNTIYVNDPSEICLSGTGPFGASICLYSNTYGIAQNDAGIKSGTNIFSNQIWNGRNSISLSNTYGTQVYENIIHQTSSPLISGQQAGIYGVNCQQISLTLNYVEGNGTTYDDLYSGGGIEVASNSAYRKSGIYLSNTQSGRVCGNTLGNALLSSLGIGYGMQFSANCQYLRVNDNIMNQSKYGIVLDQAGSSPIIPNQGSLVYSHGNQFNGPFSGTSNDHTYTFVPQYHQRPIFYYYYGYESTDPSGATNPDDKIIALQSDSASNTLCENLESASDTVLGINTNPLLKLGNSSKDSIATGHASSLMQPGYETTGPWLANRMLYSFLTDTVFSLSSVSALPPPVLLTEEQTLETLVSMLGDNADTISGQLYIYNNDSLLLSTTNGAALSTDSMILFANQTDTVDSALVTFYAAMQSTDISAIQAYLSQLQDLRSSAALNDTLLYDSAWLAAYNLNEAIPGSNIQAANFKTVQRIYLNTVQRNDTTVMDSATLDTLLNIAMQCPYAAGDAVYFARSIYAQYVDSIFFDDIVLCQSPSTDSTEAYKVPNRSDTVINEFAKVYPNPAKDLINLVYFASTIGPVEFDLLDQLGEVVMKQRLGNGQNHAQFSTEQLSSGIYYWRLKDNSRVIKTDKVAIIK